MPDGRAANCRSITARCCCSAATRAASPMWSAPCVRLCRARRSRRSRNSDPARPRGIGDNRGSFAKGRLMPELSVVVPVFNERDNIPPLLSEIAIALRGRLDYEVVYVDDASRDDSLAVLQAERARHPELRIIKHLRQSGQSTAIWNGVRAARGKWIATLDGDGQNDPADIPKLLDARTQAKSEIRLFAGWRTTRRDTFNKRISSKIANSVRSRMLRDATPDTGCGLKLFERDTFML